MQVQAVMRVLVASIPFPQNRFFVDLNGALAEHCNIEQSSDAFWKMEGEYDIVHLHFPEYLTFDLTKAYLEGLSDDLIEAVRTRLEFWSERARTVVTRHVLLPHDAIRDPQWEKLYAIFYRYADAVVHFAGASEKEFRSRYKSLEFHRGRPPRHRVIPHQNYASLPNNISRDEARKQLGISRNACVMLAFGAIRSDEERDLVLHTFRQLQVGKKVLLVSRWRETLPDVSWIRLKYWLRDLTRAYYRAHPQYVLNYDFVPEEDTQLFLNSCDVLFIPRLRVLNSGNVTLGMTFGRVVVGPDSWDVGEILRDSGNPVFDPDLPESAIEAVERGFALARDGDIPRANRETALRDWTPKQCAARYMDLFTTLANAE
jgi:glycosyltransferase involved in cell wall biosynthesis